MGDEWGVNRSVSQIHGLLYLAEAPMTADDIAETLGMARELVDRWYMQMLNVPRPRLIALIKLGEKIVSFLPMGKAK